MQRGILITGGAHGIGKQICLDFLRQGDKVCFIDINEEASKRFESEYHDLYYYYGDVANPDTLKNYVDFAKKRLGRIDVLVNNACKGMRGILSDIDYNTFDYVLSIGLKAPYELSRLCKEELKIKERLLILLLHERFSQSPIVRHMPVQKVES